MTSTANSTHLVASVASKVHRRIGPLLFAAWFVAYTSEDAADASPTILPMLGVSSLILQRPGVVLIRAETMGHPRSIVTTARGNPLQTEVQPTRIASALIVDRVSVTERLTLLPISDAIRHAVTVDESPPGPRGPFAR